MKTALEIFASMGAAERQMVRKVAGERRWIELMNKVRRQTESPADLTRKYKKEGSGR